jgi:RNA polymerase-binding transcription factor DksA
MEVVKFTENKDGSATLDLNLTEEEINIFVGYAVNDVLKKHIKKLEQDNKRYCFKCNNIIDNKTLKDYPNTEVCLECIKDS